MGRPKRPGCCRSCAQQHSSPPTAGAADTSHPRDFPGQGLDAKQYVSFPVISRFCAIDKRFSWLVRAPTLAEAREIAKRVVACFVYVPLLNAQGYGLYKNAVSRAAVLASDCYVKINEIKPPCYELRQNKALGASKSICIIFKQNDLT